MAYTIGKFGTGAILNLIGLIATFYVTAALFVFVVLGIIARIVGFSILKFLAYIKDELLIVLGTSSSESALPSLMEKLERLGCSKPVVGLVVPTGYSFNLDGTNIYMTLATLFIAQALGFDLTFGQQLTILLVAMLTSKGASGITGAGFITLAATLAVVDPRLVPGMAILLGIDKFMSECRALTNLSAMASRAWWSPGGKASSITRSCSPISTRRSTRPTWRPPSLPIDSRHGHCRGSRRLNPESGRKIKRRDFRVRASAPRNDKPPGFAGRFFRLRLTCAALLSRRRRSVATTIRPCVARLRWLRQGRARPVPARRRARARFERSARAPALQADQR